MLARKSKGFTLIEVIVSLCIVSIGLTAIMSAEIMALNVKHEQEQEDKAIFILETVNKIIINNLTYDEVFNFFGNNVRYIDNPQMNEEQIKKSNIIDVCSSKAPLQYSYIEIKALKDESYDVMKITLNYVMDEKKDLTYVFYKGKY